MNETRTTAPHAPRTRLARAAGLGATTAVVSGLLAVTGPASTAHAAAAEPASGPVRYSCTGPLGLVRLGVEVDVTNLPGTAPTELLMRQGLAFDISIDFPSSLFGGLLGGLFGGGLLGGGLGGGLEGQIEDFDLGFGDEVLPVDDLGDDVDSPATDPTMDTDGNTDGFRLPEPGEYDVTLPDSFSFSPLDLLGLQLFSVDCRLASRDDVVDEVVVDEQESETDTEVVTEPGEAPVVVTTVTRELGGKAAGAVVATVGTKVVGRSALKRGVARVKLTKLAPGTRSVKLTYLGNGSTDRSSSRVALPRR